MTESKRVVVAAPRGYCAGVDRAVRRMSTRLSKNGDVMRNALDDLERHADAIADGFDVFFPELITFAESLRHENQ